MILWSMNLQEQLIAGMLAAEEALIVLFALVLYTYVLCISLFVLYCMYFYEAALCSRQIFPQDKQTNLGSWATSETSEFVMPSLD